MEGLFHRTRGLVREDYDILSCVGKLAALGLGSRIKSATVGGIQGSDDLVAVHAQSRPFIKVLELGRVAMDNDIAPDIELLWMFHIDVL